MVGLYPQYPNRHKISLDGIWDFAWLGNIDSASFSPEDNTPHFDERAAVPGCFNLAGTRIGVHGAGLYRTYFEFPAGAVRLKFEGLGLYARIWLDGVDLGEIKTPYASVGLDVVLKDVGNNHQHELLVLVDNRFGNEKTVPLFKPYADFHGYGGIYRSATVSQLPDFHLERVKVSTLDLSTGRVGLEIRLGGVAAPTERLRVSYAFDDGASVDVDVAATGNGTASIIETHVPHHQIWSPDHPALHLLTLTISHPDQNGGYSLCDTIVERFGIRTVSTSGRDILLNNNPVRLIGLNRHESHPQFGAVQPLQLITDDLQWARELNANFIRTAHYQPDPKFLAACDQTGFLVWTESFGWHQPESDAQNSEIVSLLRVATEELVRETVNNPSVIIYGFLNESCSDTTAGRELYKTLTGAIRNLDRTRLVSYASDRFDEDLCFDLADVISINPYPGWIIQKGASGAEDWTRNCLDHVRPEFERWSRHFSEIEEYSQKPLLVSETGACGIYGIRDRIRSQWSEEFQQDYFDASIRAVLDNPRYAGITLWQMFDCLSFVNVGPSIRTKPRGYNNAGLLDEYRRPKLAFDTVKTLFEHYRKRERATAKQS